MKNNVVLIIFLLCLLVFSNCFNGVYSEDITPATLRARIYKTNLKRNVVVFNVKTKKYHNAGCEWAKKCTRNCIYIKRSEVLKRNGIPCKVCGG
ncbi:MAG: hypothetical protein WC197_02345 [Candidatus Gastranaerophilaceae bacterium]|jgi:hypothetical protein